jgi:hypothetical protein
MAVLIRNFSLRNAKAVKVAPTNVSDRIVLPGGGADILLFNPSVKTIRVRTGGDDVEADDEAMPILPGILTVYDRGPGVGSDTHLAFWTATGTHVLEIFTGAGL